MPDVVREPAPEAVALQREADLVALLARAAVVRDRLAGRDRSTPEDCRPGDRIEQPYTTRQCHDYQPGSAALWHCTLPRGHSGPQHVAHARRVVIAVWPVTQDGDTRG